MRGAICMTGKFSHEEGVAWKKETNCNCPFCGMRIPKYLKIKTGYFSCVRCKALLCIVR